METIIYRMAEGSIAGLKDKVNHFEEGWRDRIIITDENIYLVAKDGWYYSMSGDCQNLLLSIINQAKNSEKEIKELVIRLKSQVKISNKNGETIVRLENDYAELIEKFQKLKISKEELLAEGKEIQEGFVCGVVPADALVQLKNVFSMDEIIKLHKEGII
jgi:hypothetical protein